MPPPIALLLCILFILFLFKMDSKREPKVSRALWIPLIWMLAIGSRPIIFWLNLGSGITITETANISGSPIDRTLFIVLTVAAILILSKREIYWSQIMKRNFLMILFVLYCGISILWSDYPFVSFKRWVMGLGYFIMVLLVLTEANPIEALKSIFRRYSYVFIPLSIVLIKYYPYLGRGYDPWTGVPVNIGITTDKNNLGQSCLICGLFYAWHFLLLWRKKKIPVNTREISINFLFLLMISWLLIQASSATSFMSLIIGICIFTGLSAIKRNVRQAGVIILVGMATFFLLLLSLDAIEIIISSLGRATTLSGRTELWYEVLDIDNNPLIGAGFDSFWLGNRVRPLWEKHWWRPTQAHNGYIEIYLNLGLIGLFFIIGVAMSTYAKICKVLPFDFDFGRFQMAYLFVFLMTNITENIIFRGVMWFIFLFIAIDCPHCTPLKGATTMK